MAEKKTTKKSSSSKVSVKKSVDNITDNILDKVSTKDGKSISSNKTIKKLLKKIPTAIKILGVVLFVVGGLLGSFVGARICKNDTFELLPYDSKFTIGCEANLTIPGVKLISYGRDISDKVQLEVSEGLVQNEDGTFTIEDTSQENVYYIIYTTKDIKFSKIQKIRYIYVNSLDDVGESISGDVQNGGNQGGVANG